MKKTISLLVLLIASASHIGAQEADSAFVPAPNQNPAETSTNFTVKVRLETEMDLNLVSSVAAFELHPSFPSIFKAGDRVLHQDGLIRKDRFSEDAILRSSQKDGFVSFTFPNPGWYVIFSDGWSDEFWYSPEEYAPKSADLGTVYFFEASEDAEVTLNVEVAKLVEFHLPDNKEGFKGEAFLIATCADPRGLWFQWAEIQNDAVSFKGLPDGDYQMQLLLPRGEEKFSISFVDSKIHGEGPHQVTVPPKRRIPLVPLPKGRKVLRTFIPPLNLSLDLTGKISPPSIYRWEREDWSDGKALQYKLIDKAVADVEHLFQGVAVKVKSSQSLAPFQVRLIDNKGRPHFEGRMLLGGEFTLILSEGIYVAELRESFSDELFATKRVEIGSSSGGNNLLWAYDDSWDFKAK